MKILGPPLSRDPRDPPPPPPSATPLAISREFTMRDEYSPVNVLSERTENLAPNRGHGAPVLPPFRHLCL